MAKISYGISMVWGYSMLAYKLKMQYLAFRRNLFELGGEWVILIRDEVGALYIISKNAILREPLTEKVKLISKTEQIQGMHPI